MERRCVPDIIWLRVKYAPALFQAWEDGNKKAFRALAQLLSSWSQKRNYIAERENAKVRILRTLGQPSLVQLCFQNASLEERKRLLPWIPEQVISEHFQRRRASRVVRNFLSAWSVSHRCSMSKNDLDLVVGESRAVWEPSHLSFKDMYKLFCKYQVAVRRRSCLHEVALGMSCLWLVNPAVLAVLAVVFLVGDVALPFLRKRLANLLRVLRQMIDPATHKFRQKKIDESNRSEN